MIKGEKIWLNGRILNWEEAKIHIISDTFNYGYGVFEGIRCYKSQKGRAIFRLRDHIERLKNVSNSILILCSERLRTAGGSWPELRW